jgi:hypothetical protein
MKSRSAHVNIGFTLLPRMHYVGKVYSDWPASSETQFVMCHPTSYTRVTVRLSTRQTGGPWPNRDDRSAVTSSFGVLCTFKSYDSNLEIQCRGYLHAWTRMRSFRIIRIIKSAPSFPNTSRSYRFTLKNMSRNIYSSHTTSAMCTSTICSIRRRVSLKQSRVGHCHYKPRNFILSQIVILFDLKSYSISNSVVLHNAVA